MRLVARRILYCPDYIINAGGVISISHEGPLFNRERMMLDVERIGPTLGAIFEIAARKSLPTGIVADMQAEAVLSR